MKYTHIITLADLHLKNNDPMGYGYGVENTRTQRKLQILRDAVEKAQYRESGTISLLVLLGDIFDNPRIDEGIRAAYAKILGDGIRDGVRVVHILGNHPIAGRSVPLASEFALINSCLRTGGYDVDMYTVVSNDTIFEDFHELEFDDWNLFFLPFNSVENTEKLLNELGRDDKEILARTIIFGHFGLKMAWMTDDIISDSGVDKKYIEPFRGVFLGDYHRHQFFTGPHNGRNNEKLHCYVGSAAAVNFGESTYPHLIGVTRLYEDGTWENTFTDSDDSPVQTFSIHFDDPVDTIDVKPGSLVRIVFKGTRSELAQLNSAPLVNIAKEKGAVFVDVKTEVIDDEKRESIVDPTVLLDSKLLINQFAGGDDERERIGQELFNSAAD